MKNIFTSKVNAILGKCLKGGLFWRKWPTTFGESVQCRKAKYLQAFEGALLQERLPYCAQACIPQASKRRSFIAVICKMKVHRFAPSFRVILVAAYADRIVDETVQLS